ncbi:MAG: glycine betaine ABC transporter substrate-binding protein [Solirubrobacteraceae bacterium]|nr:glycine betaine ABC transporter substrate-binding protein [Patulibacter sp.]
MSTLSWRRIAAPVALTATLALGVAGCGSSDTDSAKGSASTGGIELKVGQFSWTAAAVETNILADIAKAHPDLGVKSVKVTPVDPAPGWVGLGRGDLDLLTEVNLPNQQDFADKAKATTSLVSETYGGATQGWFVPRYAVEGAGAPAAGLTSIDQLNQYKSVFDGTLYDSDPGWVTSQQNKKRIKAYGLDYKQSNSSEAALIAQVGRAFAKKQPILFYFYHPHWLFKKYDVVQLKEPNPYNPATSFKTDDKSAIPTLAAWIAVNNDLKTKAPEFYAALSKVKIPLADIEGLLEQVDAKKQQPADVAQQWVDAHKTEIDQWVS